MPLPTASFPTSVWDTLTQNRVDKHAYTAPMAAEYMEVLSEIVAIEKHVRPTKDDSVIWVAPHGVAANATGSIVNPYATLAAAFAAITASKLTVCLMPGTYTLAAVQALPIAQDGVKIIGVGGSSVTTISGADADYALGLAPAAQGAAFTITLEGITVDAFAAKIGLYVDDTSIDGAVTINLKDVHMTMDTSGDSIDVLHAEAQALVLNVEDCTFTGSLELDCVNAGDVYTFTRCNLAAGLVTDATDIAASLFFYYCEILSAGVTGGHSTQVITALYCTSSDGTLAETGEFAGSQTETLISPVSA